MTIPANYIISAFRQQHQLLENEKKALEEEFAKIKHQEEALRQHEDWIEGIIHLLSQIEHHDDYLSRQIVAKIANEHHHVQAQDIYKSLEELKRDRDTLKKIQDQLNQLQGKEEYEARTLSQANWKVRELFNHVLETTENTIKATESAFKQNLGLK